MAKYLDSNGLLYLWQKITGKFVEKEDGKGLSTNDFTTELKNKLDGVEAGAQKNVKPDWSAGSGTAAEILNKPTIPTKTSELTNDSNFITDAYTKSETYSKTEVDGKLSSVYKPAGNCLFANLPQPSASNLGNVYSMMDAFTTDDRFVASQPTQYPIGTNVAVVQVMVEDTPTYLFDVLAGFVDLSGYMKKTDMVAITNQEIDEIVA